MRSQLVPLLLKQHGQAGPSTNAVCGAVSELHGALRSLVVSPSCRRLSAASSAVAQEPAVAAASETAEAGSSGTDAAAAQELASSDANNSSQPSSSNDATQASSSSSSTSNGGKSNGRSGPSKSAELLQQMGLWVSMPTHRKMNSSAQERLAALQKLVPLLREHPAAGMSAACINPYQLQTVVTPAVSREGLHPLEYSEAQLQHKLQQQAKQKKQRKEAAAGRGLPRGSDYLSNTKQLIAQLEAQRESEVWRVTLASSNLVRENSSELMVNLNTQMSNALAADPQDLVTAVNLFDQLLDQGIRAALEQQQQRQRQRQAQQQEGEGAEGQAAGLKELVLPAQYRPDSHAFNAFCKAATRLAERHSARQRALKGMDGGGGAHTSSPRFFGGSSSRGSEEVATNEVQLLMIRARAKQLAQSVKRVSGLWDPDKDKYLPSGKFGAFLHQAVMAAYRAAGQHTEAMEYWDDLRGRINPNVLQQYWRLPFYATAAAMSYGNLEAADRYALVFSDKVNGVAFRKEEYQRTIGPMFDQLVHKMAAAQMWDQAVYWLQQLLNHDPLMQVEDASFLVVQHQAAKHGRMDLARVMMAAMDDTRKIQGYKPYVYSEFQCIDLMTSAARANDLPFIDAMWQRLTDDLQRDRSANSKDAPGSLIDANSDIVRAISGDAAAPSDAEEPKPSLKPSAHAHAQAIRAYVMCEAYGKAFELLNTMEQRYPGAAACSVYSGVRFFPESLDTEAKIGAAFEQLQQRQKAGQPISTTMMNVLTRALARSSDTTTVGKVFNAYEPTYGLQPDVDTYNAVLESCEAHAKVNAVNGMLALMSSRGVAPNTVSWNLLLSTSIRAGDGRHVVAALNRMREAGIRPSKQLLSDALDLAMDNRDAGLKAVLHQVVPSVVGHRHKLVWRLNGGREGSSSSITSSSDRWKPRRDSKGSSSSSSSRAGMPAERWRPNTPGRGGQESGGELLEEQVAREARV